MMFHIGQKVVCVDDSGLTGLRNGFPSIPSKGGVYTVRGIHTGPGQQGLWLDEIKNPVVRFTLYDWVGEGSFKLHRFRPVVEKIHRCRHGDPEGNPGSRDCPRSGAGNIVIGNFHRLVNPETAV